MADIKALVIESGKTRQIADADSLIVSMGIKSRATQALTITSSSGAAVMASDLQFASGKGFSSAGGAGAFNLSGSTGTFLTPTGAITIGPGAVTISGAATFSSTAAFSSTSTFTGLATFDGGIQVNGAETITGGVTYQGDVTIGDAIADTLTITAGVAGDITFRKGTGNHAVTTETSTVAGETPGILKVQGGTGAAGTAAASPTASGGGGATQLIGGTGAAGVATSTAGQLAAEAGAGAAVTVKGGTGGAGTAATGTVDNAGAGAGGALTVSGGDAGTAGSGTGAPAEPGAAGGALTLKSGAATGTATNGADTSVQGGAKAGTGTDGKVKVGDLNTSAVEILVAGKATTVKGSLTVDQAATLSSTLAVTGATNLNGAVTLGDAAGDTITVTGTLTVTPAATFSNGLTVTAGGITISLGGANVTGALTQQTGALSLTGNAAVADLVSASVGNLTLSATAAGKAAQVEAAYPKLTVTGLTTSATETPAVKEACYFAAVAASSEIRQLKANGTELQATFFGGTPFAGTVDKATVAGVADIKVVEALVAGDLGTPVYASTTAGQLTKTAPSAAGQYVTLVGIVMAVNAAVNTEAKILLRPAHPILL